MPDNPKFLAALATFGFPVALLAVLALLFHSPLAGAAAMLFAALAGNLVLARARRAGTVDLLDVRRPIAQ